MISVPEIIAKSMLEHVARGVPLNALRTSHRVLRECGLTAMLGNSLHDGKISTSLWGLKVLYDERDVLFFARVTPRFTEKEFLAHPCREINPEALRPYVGDEDFDEQEY